MATNSVTLLQGTTANATDVENKVNPLYTDIDSSNVGAANKTGTGKFVLQTSPVLAGTITGTYTFAGTPTITAPTITSPTISGTVSGGASYTSPIITGSIALYSGADLNIYSDAGSTLKFTVDGATGDFGMVATRKFYLDGTALTGDTYISESSANNMLFQVGGSGTLNLTVDSVKIPATFKLYLDGGGNTYLWEVGADEIQAVAGGASSFIATANYFYAYHDIIFPSGNKLYLDGGFDTYIYESAANDIQIVTGGVNRFRMRTSTSDVNVQNSDFTVDATKKLYLDGGGDTYFYESAVNTLDFFAGGTHRLRIAGSVQVITGSFSIPSGSGIYFDGISDTYDTESSANVLDRYAGGVLALRTTATTAVIHTNTTFNTSGEVLLGNVDPPTANYMNRNSGCKGWLYYVDGSGSVSNSFNVSSVTSDDGDGIYGVSWDTNFNTSSSMSVVAAVDSLSSTDSFITATSSTTTATINIYDISAAALTDHSFYVSAMGVQ